MNLTLLLMACGTNPVEPVVDLADDYNFRMLCIEQGDIDYCMEKAEEAGPDSDRARHAYTVACTTEYPGACAHFVRTFHKRDPVAAVQFASSACAVKGELCDEFHEFETLYPELESQFEIARPHGEKANKAREAEAATP